MVPNKISAILITGRSLGQGIGKEYGRFSEKYSYVTRSCEMNPRDMERLGVRDGSSINIRNRFGEIVVRVTEPSQDLPEGSVFIPYGPWANVLVDPDSEGTGMPTLKGILIEMEPSQQEVPEKSDARTPDRIARGPSVEGTRAIQDVVCPFCGCLCDDLEVLVRNDRIVAVERACILSLSKFLNYERERIYSSTIRRDGCAKDVRMEEAIERAAQLLAESKYPVTYGWSTTSNEAIEIGVELTELIGGVIDNTTTICHGPAILAEEEVGLSTCTLGNVRHRADLVIYWGANPLQSHPRHIARYTVGTRGRFRPSREDRTMVVVDVRKTYTARVADYFIQIEPNKDFELLNGLRSTIRGIELAQETVAGVRREAIEELADLMISCEFGILFFGVGLTMSSGKLRNIGEAISLVDDLNARTKFNIMPMRGHFNVAGANMVLSWQTGYPYAVDFCAGYPRYNPGDTSIIDILSRRDSDLALVIGSDPLATFPAPIARRLSEIPMIVIDPRRTLTGEKADVVIPSAPVGIEAAGTAHRMDGVPIMLRKLKNPPVGINSDVEILQMILNRVKELKGRN
jgi:formylmethanofuran dehydrogenase subunit B